MTCSTSLLITSVLLLLLLVVVHGCLLPDYDTSDEKHAEEDKHGDYWDECVDWLCDVICMTAGTDIVVNFATMMASEIPRYGECRNKRCRCIREDA